MPGKFTKIANRIFLFFNILAAIGFLLACLASYLNPERWWFISVLGLGFPIAFVLVLFFVFFWLIFRPRYMLISVVSLIIGYKSISVFFAFHATSDFNLNKPKDVLRVVHWNVARFTEWKRNNNKGSQTRLKMLDLLKRQNADVLCLSEFFHSTDTVYYDNLNYVMENLGYPYYYYSWDEDGGKQWVGQVIFSRHPIIDSGMIRFPKPGLPESLIHADILFNKDTIRLYTTHLQSVQFKKQDYESIEKIKNRDDSLLQNSKSIFSKLKRGMVIRSQQAEIVRNRVKESPHSTIVTGDFNDVPNSYTYFTIRKGLQDAFLKRGSGLGRTYTGIAPTLRIDYILSSKDLEVLQFHRYVRNYSDHYMLVADFKTTD